LSYLTSLMHITSVHEFLDLDLRITQAFKRLSVDSKSCAMDDTSWSQVLPSAWRKRFD